VYINGELVLGREDLRGRQREWANHDLTAHAGTVRPGKNVIAIHATHKVESRVIDAGLYTVR